MSEDSVWAVSHQIKQYWGPRRIPPCQCRVMMKKLNSICQNQAIEADPCSGIIRKYHGLVDNQTVFSKGHPC